MRIYSGSVIADVMYTQYKWAGRGLGVGRDIGALLKVGASLGQELALAVAAIHRRSP